MTTFKNIPVYYISDAEVIKILKEDNPKFIFFVENPEILNKYFKKIQNTIVKITSGYYNTKIKPENIYIIKTSKLEIEDVLMENFENMPVGLFSATPGEYSLMTF